MITAIRKVHLEKGPWAAKGGYEYNLVLLAALLALADDCPGDASLDAALGSGASGPLVAIGQLAAGALGLQIAIAGIRSAVVVARRRGAIQEAKAEAVAGQ